MYILVISSYQEVPKLTQHPTLMRAIREVQECSPLWDSQMNSAHIYKTNEEPDEYDMDLICTDSDIIAIDGEKTKFGAVPSKIRVTGATIYEEAWYKNHIGETYKVYDIAGDGGSYIILTQEHPYHHISIQDCEVVE